MKGRGIEFIEMATTNVRIGKRRSTRGMQKARGTRSSPSGWHTATTMRCSASKRHGLQARTGELGLKQIALFVRKDARNVIERSQAHTATAEEQQ